MLVIHCTSWQEAAPEHTALLLHPSELQEYNFVCITAALLVTFATPGMRHEAKRCYLFAQKSAQKQGHSADVRRCCAEMEISQLLVRGVCVENKHQPWLHSVRSLLYCSSLRLTLDFTTSQVHTQLQAGTPRFLYANS